MLSGLFILLPLMLLWIGLKELVRMCRYITRPAVVVPRLSLSSTGKVVYTLKTIYEVENMATDHPKVTKATGDVHGIFFSWVTQ
jgi:hypothetical protein